MTKSPCFGPPDVMRNSFNSRAPQIPSRNVFPRPGAKRSALWRDLPLVEFLTVVPLGHLDLPVFCICLVASSILQGEAPVAMEVTEKTSGVSDFLLEIYHDAAECTPDELRLRVLKNLQRFIPFDFGVWGGGWADGRLVTDLTVLNQSEALLGEWEAVAQQDAFCDLALNRLGAQMRLNPEAPSLWIYCN